MPKIDLITDWIVYLEVVFSTIQTIDDNKNFLNEAYIFQFLQTLFFEEDFENSKLILEKISSNINSSLISSPETVIMTHIFIGLLFEKKSLIESEQNYMLSLILIHKLYGDPRGRGSITTPLELFITSRLSILARIQGKIQDAEYSEEIFDSANFYFQNKNKSFFFFFFK